MERAFRVSLLEFLDELPFSSIEESLGHSRQVPPHRHSLQTRHSTGVLFTVQELTEECWVVRGLDLPPDVTLLPKGGLPPLQNSLQHFGGIPSATPGKQKVTLRLTARE